MKAKVEISVGGYGFGHYWTLVVNNKSFYLGQDVKFCSRVLGMSPAYVVEQIGSRDIEDPVVNARLAKFITKSLGLTSKNINKIEIWELSAE